MLKRIAVLGFVCLLCFGGAALAGDPVFKVDTYFSSNLTPALKANVANSLWHGYREITVSCDSFASTVVATIPGPFSLEVGNDQQDVVLQSAAYAAGVSHDITFEYFPRGNRFIPVVATGAITAGATWSNLTNENGNLDEKTINYKVDAVSYSYRFDFSGREMWAGEHSNIPYVEVLYDANYNVTGVKGHFETRSNPGTVLSRAIYHSGGHDLNNVRLHLRYFDGGVMKLATLDKDSFTYNVGDKLEFSAKVTAPTGVKTYQLQRVRVVYDRAVPVPNGASRVETYSLRHYASSPNQWMIHRTSGVMNGLKSDPTTGMFANFNYGPSWNNIMNAPKSGTAKFSVGIKLNAWDDYNVSKDIAANANFDVAIETQSGNSTYYAAAFKSGDKEYLSSITTADTALQNKTVSLDIGGRTLARTLNFVTTAGQFSKAVPYLELTKNDNGFITGGLVRMAKKDTTGTAVNSGSTDDPALRLFNYFRITFSVDGTKNNTREIGLNFSDGKPDWYPTSGQKLEAAATLPQGLESVIRADRVTRVRVKYQSHNIQDFEYDWRYNNNENRNKLVDELAKPKPVTDEDGKETGVVVTVASVDLSGTGFTLPKPESIDVKKASPAVAVVTKEVEKAMPASEFKIVKTAELIIEYSAPAAASGNMVYPTTITFEATSTDLGDKVWKLIANDKTPQTILNHARVFKIVPTNINRVNAGNAVVDLMAKVDKKDWEKVFSAWIEDEKVIITVKIMIQDGTDSDASGKILGLQQVGDQWYLLYLDGNKNGKFEDPIAIVAQGNPAPANVSDPSPKNNASSGSGCNVAFAPFALLLFAAPFFFRKRK